MGRVLVLGAVVLAVGVAGGAMAFASSLDQAPPVAGDLHTVLNNIRNWIMGILASLALVFLSIAGVRYLMSNGDPGEINKAKDALRNAGWGFGLAALAPVAVAILKQLIAP